MKNNVIVDLDGTLAVIEHRLHFVEGDKKDWEGFFQACQDDLPNQDVIRVVKAIAESGTGADSFKIHIFSGRSEAVRSETERWLEKHIDFEFSLVMRPVKDHRPDDVLKKEMFQERGLSPENVLCVIDDRRSVVEMWRREGFSCFQVADHDF